MLCVLINKHTKVIIFIAMHSLSFTDSPENPFTKCTSQIRNKINVFQIRYNWLAKDSNLPNHSISRIQSDNNLPSIFCDSTKDTKTSVQKVKAGHLISYRHNWDDIQGCGTTKERRVVHCASNGPWTSDPVCVILFSEGPC